MRYCEQLGLLSTDILNCFIHFSYILLAKGFNDTGYFPTMISKSFKHDCFYGDVSNTE